MTFKQWWDGIEWSLGARLLFKPLAQLFAEIAWNAAVRAEREACAKVAERFEPDEKTSYVTYASTAIRARGQA
jgi:hypothetical protein